MAIALSALEWSQALNPGDTVDFDVDLTGRLLEVGETVASYTLTLSAASIAAGLVLGTGSYASSQPTATSLLFWFSIASGHVADSAFDGTGAVLDMELLVTTTNVPPRIRQRTLLLHVARQ